MITITQEALKQYQLIVENDFTVTGKKLRLQISGKKCEGFLYEVGLDFRKPGDIIRPAFLNNSPKDSVIEVFLQPFTDEYCQDVTIEYIQDFMSEIDGFNVINHNQSQYEGKFFKDKL
jgi:Fe-S cluster assembly iron-binding protein IscA